jgi:hypothetical protein
MRRATMAGRPRPFLYSFNKASRKRRQKAAKPRRKTGEPLATYRARLADWQRAQSTPAETQP